MSQETQDHVDDVMEEKSAKQIYCYYPDSFRFECTFFDIQAGWKSMVGLGLIVVSIVLLRAYLHF